MVRTFRRSIGFTACILSACAIEPKFGPDEASEGAYNSAPTLPHAVAVGESMHRRYQEVLTEQIRGSRWSALGLIGLSVVGSDLAMRGVNGDSVLGLGLGGAGVYAGSTVLNGKPLPSVYAAGANAVQCALDAMQPRRIGYARLADLKRDIATIGRDVATLDAALAPYDNNPGLNDRSTTRAKAARTLGKDVLADAKETVLLLETSGTELHIALSAIEKDVTQAVVNNTDLDTLAQNLGTTLPSMASKIITKPTKGIPATPAALPSGSEDLAVSQELLDAISDAEEIVAIANARPSGASLKNCRVDPVEAGVTMTITPSGGVTLAAGEATTFTVSGGKLPYQPATWSGTHPPSDKVTIDTETGQGVVTLKATRDATPGSYAVLIRDGAQGRALVALTVLAGSSTGNTAASGNKGGTGTTPAEACVVKNAQVKSVQKALIAKGVSTVTVNGKPETLKADSCLGPITVAAMQVFYKSQGGPVAKDQIPPDPQQLLKDTAALLEAGAKVGDGGSATAPAVAAAASSPVVPAVAASAGSAIKK